MNADILQSNASFSMHFGSEEKHEMSADVLAKELSVINELMITAQDEFYPDSKIQLKVVATQEGSFQVVFNLLMGAVATLLLPGNIEYAAKLCSIIGSMIDLKKFLGGKEPEKVKNISNDQIEVTNSNNETKNYNKDTRKFFENSSFDNCIINMISTVEGDDTIDKIHFDYKDNSVKIEKSDFKNMVQPVVKETTPETRDIESTDTYVVRNPVYIGDEQWSLVKDKRIYAKINDKEWLRQFQNREIMVLPGDMLRVRLLTTLEFDKNGMPKEGTAKHTVLEVEKIITPKEYEQMQLNL